MNLLKPNLTSEAVEILNVLESHECDSIVNCLSDLKPIQAKVGNMNIEVNDTLRNSNIVWIPYGNEESQKYDWIYRKVSNLVATVNNTHFQYDLIGFDAIQYTIYDTKDKNGFYDCHKDIVIHDGGTIRKLSFTIQLSDPSEYEGGEVLIYDNNLHTPFEVSKQKGTVMAFPSYLLHEVKPVTKGIRKSLVVWVVGPAFK